MAPLKEVTTTEHKLTAAQVEKDCPVMLQDLGRRIAVHSDKARKCEEKAEQHYTTIAQLLVTAQRACDDGGFNAFREMFFPNLGKSRVYELLTIGTNKKSFEEIKASTRARVAKHRAIKAKAPPSVTVTDKPEPGAQGAPEIEAPSIASEHVPEPTNPPSSVSPGHEALIGFSSVVCKLVQITRNKKAERYAKTTVSVDELASLGKFLTDVANLKMSGADVPVLSGNGIVSPEQSAGEMKANAALEASVDLVARHEHV
jgi:hypothetical protein